MPRDFPYQITAFIGKEPSPNEPVYYGKNGWYPQIAIKRRFRLNGLTESTLIDELKTFFSRHGSTPVNTGALVKPDGMPVRVIDVPDQDLLMALHNQLIAGLGDKIISRYPERDGDNYYAHVTAEHKGSFMFSVGDYVDKGFLVDKVWLLKDVDDENSVAYAKLTQIP